MKRRIDSIPNSARGPADDIPGSFSMQKEEFEVNKRLLTEYGVSMTLLKELDESLHAVQEFVQYLGTNQYYSDAVNKKIFLLTLDVDTLILRLQALHLQAARFQDTLFTAVLSKKKTGLEANAVTAYKTEFAVVMNDVGLLHKRALELTQDIRMDYSRKL
ncbi:hypothetical protein HYV43_01025 [Candidatus Micrarchaeota archaeon]|nr:hypothetical protein [Candidatus Micrarchaeota archaeon]